MTRSALPLPSGRGPRRRDRPRARGRWTGRNYHVDGDRRAIVRLLAYARTAEGGGVDIGALTVTAE
jgi:hypothetical protein